MKRWFDGSISFACTACGKCCTSAGSTKVFVNRKEIQNIASRIGMHEKSFLVQYVDERVDDTGKHFHSLKKHHTKNQCIFLNGSKCSIYNDRPTQCRTYPYWPHVMIGDAEWKGEARNCEGILLDSLRSRLDLAPKVDVDTVALNMIVHQIHDRGLGENWTYDEAVELLMDSKKDSPELFDDYLKGFYEDSESYTVYEDEVLRVVDSKAIDEDGGYTYSRRMEFVNSPALAQTEMYMQCTDEEWGRNKKDLSLDGTHAAHSTAKSSSAVSSSQLDYATLHMPVHRVIGGICADYLSRTHVKGSPEHQQRVAVIGAGCCALPAYLLMHDSSSGIEDKFNERGGSSGGDPTVSRSWSSTRSPFKDQLAVHAVEPCAEVLDAAEKFFGIHFDLHRLVKHVETGSQYLRGAVGVQCSIASEGKDEGMMEGQHRYHDVIIIDAFADGDRDANQRSNAATTVHMDCHNTDRDKDGRKDGRDNDVLLQCAPPEELLVDLPLLAAALTDPRNSTRAGLLLVNVYGPSDWVEVVVAKIESTRLFCPVLVFPTTAAAVLNAQISSNGPLSTMDSRNVVLVTAPLAVGELLVELGAVDVMSLLQRN